MRVLRLWLTNTRYFTRLYYPSSWEAADSVHDALATSFHPERFRDAARSPVCSGHRHRLQCYHLHSLGAVVLLPNSDQWALPISSERPGR